MNEILVTRTSMPEYDEYIELIKSLWESHWVTNMGNFHNELEMKLKNYLGVPELSLMVNGHMALEMGIQALELPYGGEVITTPFTFVSTTHAIVRNGLIPVFCDIKTDDYTIDETKIESLITDKTVAIVAVHVYGNVCNVDKIQEIANRHNLKVIYDAAHAFGVKYKNVGIGNYGDISIFSFHATKVYNTIEGGAVTFNSDKIYDKLYNLKNFGIRNEELIVDVGANAKMNEFAAAMGLCNLKYVDKNIQLRKKLVKHYIERLCNIKGLVLLDYHNDDIEHNYAYFPILLQDNEMRNMLYEKLKCEKIYSRKYFYPLTSDIDCYKNKVSMCELKNARYVSDRILVLPLYPDLGESQVDRICQSISRILSN